MAASDNPKAKKELDLAYKCYADGMNNLNNNQKDPAYSNFSKAATHAKEESHPHPDIAAKAYYQLAELHREDKHWEFAGVFYRLAYTQELLAGNPTLKFDIIAGINKCIEVCKTAEAMTDESRRARLLFELRRELQGIESKEVKVSTVSAVMFHYPVQEASSVPAEHKHKFRH